MILERFVVSILASGVSIISGRYLPLSSDNAQKMLIEIACFCPALWFFAAITSLLAFFKDNAKSAIYMLQTLSFVMRFL